MPYLNVTEVESAVTSLAAVYRPQSSPNSPSPPSKAGPRTPCGSVREAGTSTTPSC
ncbi:hypothetical protein QA942_28290 [Streptomyces sp. B21-106]|uniref:hypothetical protein n=1 Tax=Streptomyces sp. B21-106 TaxID=3039418 RepID=UPI002FF14937